MGDIYRTSIERERIEAKTCESIEDAARLMKAAQEIMRIAQHHVSQASLETFMGNQWYRITLPDEAEATVVLDGNIIETQPTTFIATELTSIGQHGTEFKNIETGHELHLRGYDFEITPIE